MSRQSLWRVQLYVKSGLFLDLAAPLLRSTRPCTGIAIGENVLYGCSISVTSETSASVALIQYWTDINAAWVTILIIVCDPLVVFIAILGLVIDLGGVPGLPQLGFHYWKYPGPFVEYINSESWGCFLGWWACMANTVYSFAGVKTWPWPLLKPRTRARHPQDWQAGV